MSPQRPQRTKHMPAGGETDRAIERCRHENLRIHIQVTPDLAFEYCPHCEVRGWWSRTTGILSNGEIHSRLGKPQGL